MLRRPPNSVSHSIGHLFLSPLGVLFRLNSAVPVITALLNGEEDTSVIEALVSQNGTVVLDEEGASPKNVLFENLYENRKTGAEWTTLLSAVADHRSCVRCSSTPEGRAFVGDLSIFTSCNMFRFVSIMFNLSSGEINFLLMHRDQPTPIVFDSVKAVELLPSALNASASSSFTLSFGVGLQQPFSPSLLSIDEKGNLRHQLTAFDRQVGAKSSMVKESGGGGDGGEGDLVLGEEAFIRPFDGIINAAVAKASLSFDAVAKTVVVPCVGGGAVTVSLPPWEGRDIDAQGDNSLMRAARSGNIEKVKALIDKGSIDGSLDVNHTNNGGETALMFAAAHDHAEIARMLLNLPPTLPKINVNCKQKTGATALLWACIFDRVDCARVLLREGAAHALDVNAEANDGMRPLTFAARKGNLELIDLLLSNNKACEVDAIGAGQMTALGHAVISGHSDAVKALLDAKASIEVVGSRPLIFCAAMGGNVEVLRIVLAAIRGRSANKITTRADGMESDAVSEAMPSLPSPPSDALSPMMDANPVDNGFPALTIAASKGFADIVSELVAAGADVNRLSRDGGTALMVAAMGPHPRIVQMLVTKANADVNVISPSGRAALMSSAHHGDMASLKLLLSVGADPNLSLSGGGGGGEGEGEGEERKGSGSSASSSDGATALMFAVTGQHVEAVAELIANGAEVNAVSNAKRTALFLAACDGLVGMVVQLLDAGADPTLADEDGFTALTIAATKEHADVVEVLSKVAARMRREEAASGGGVGRQSFAHSASDWVNAVSKRGLTPLVAAIQQHCSRSVAALLKDGAADPNLVVMDGLSPAQQQQPPPLHTAIWLHAFDCVKLLIDAKADVNAWSHDGYTPLMLLMMVPFEDVDTARQLISASADVNAVSKGGTSSKGLFGNNSARPTRTALMIAAQQGHVDSVKLLLASSADRSVVSSDGSTALSCAEEHGHEALVAILRQP